MDQILKGIINSNHPKALKQRLIDKCLISSPVDVHPSVHLSVLRTSWEYAISGDTEFVQDVGVKVYTTWASYDKTLLAEFFNVSSLNHFLNDESICNKAILIKLICHTLKQLQDSSNFSTACQIIQSRSVSYLHNNRTLPVLKELITLLQSFPLCIPYGESAGRLVIIVVQSIADTEIPKSIDLLTCYVTDINAICSFLPVLWSANKDVLEKAFNAIFLRLSSNESSCSPAISCAIDVLPLQLIDNVHTNIRQTPLRKLAITVIRMLDCLSWPGVINLDKWIIAVFRGLAEAAMYTLLAKLFEATVEQVYNKLYIIVTRRSALSVLTHMLLSYQHSPVLFHKIAGDIPKLLESVKAEVTKESEMTLEELARLFFKTMFLHAGFPDLYDPILKFLEPYRPPSVTKIQEELMKYQWGKSSKYITGADNNKSRSIQLTRSSTGLTGLENIGNTCYLNAVVQALYMTGCLRHAVMGTMPNSEETLLSKLQEVFAYLALSQRPAYTPKKFVDSSLPPWFEPGVQQDCAEFLRFILDTLTEEGKALKKKELCYTGTELAINENQTDSPVAFVESIFGGVLETSHKCLNCNNTSTLIEKFTSLHIPFPDSVTAQNDSEQSTLILKDLFDKCFEPEKLEGENKYLCEKCNLHCIAERSIKITSFPSHLILNLLRFSYDPVSNKRTKILTEVDYPLQLTIQLCEDRHVDYYLYAVIVHSGTSTERGHYFTLARHSQVPFNDASSEDDRNTCRSGDHETWYIFNDESVTFSSFDKFRTMPRRLQIDTAYVLFYQKLPFDKMPQQIFHQKAAVCKELKQLITEDNVKYLSELENEIRGREEKTNLLDFKSNFYKDFDDTFPPSGGCGSSNGGSDPSFPRFVC